MYIRFSSKKNKTIPLSFILLPRPELSKHNPLIHGEFGKQLLLFSIDRNISRTVLYVNSILIAIQADPSFTPLFHDAL